MGLPRDKIYMLLGKLEEAAKESGIEKEVISATRMIIDEFFKREETVFRVGIVAGAAGGGLLVLVLSCVI